MAIRRRCGFTLIELMIAMVIVAIIVAIAYPSYVEQVRKSRRAEAKAVLLEDAQFMERTYTTTGQYDKDSAGNAVTRCSLPEQYTPASANIASSSNCGSFNGAGAYYKILFPSNPPDPADPSSTLSSNPAAAAFVLEAQPVNTQQADKCGTVTIDSVGNKGCSKFSNTTTCLETCWQ